MKMSRRGFLVGCSAAVAAYAGSSFNTLAFADPNENREILIVIFLRGGVDGLNFLPPLGGVDRSIYEAARPGIRIPTSGAGAAISLDGQFGLHPSAAPLFDLYQSQKLSIVHSVGISNLVNKSHFDAMSFVELGTPGEKTTTTGWITRHLASAANLPPELVIPSLAVGDLQPGSLLGNLETLNLADPQSFNIANGPWQWRQAQKDTLRQLYQSDSSWLHDAGSQAIDAIDIVEQNVSGGYTPSNGATYPTGPFGDQLQVLAQMIKLDLGLQVATIDLGGWDTHEGQGGSTGYFADLVDELSRGLAALYADLDGSGASNYTDRMTVVTQSEFGRELYENGDNGTEHGYGGLMMVLSGNATGGIHGTWQGLSQDALVDRTDVAVTTDYRQVLSEILVRRMCNTELETIFPGYTGYQPLGVVDGSDLRPAGIFNDGFDSGNLDAWS